MPACDPVTPNDADAFKTVTDLPLSPCGNNGNVAERAKTDRETDVWTLLDEAGEPLPRPPVELLDAEAILDWIERASARLLFRRDRQRLLREAMRVLDDDWRTALATDRLREQFDRQQDRLAAKAAGTYWRERDAYRRATQSEHVVVNGDAWDRAKLKAIVQRSTVGAVVGRLVTAEARMPLSRGWTADGARDRRGEVRLFARVGVSTESWAKFRLLASRDQVTVERLVGVLVEEAFPLTGRDR